MKRTIDVNIGGFVFHIDEDAYQRLNTYLESLKRHYGGSEEGKEIINDIESRIAELLNEKKSAPQEVINIGDINEIIAILGNPEDIFEEESDETKVSYKVAKKLYRDTDNRIFGGVASGLAAYFGLPIALIRILFIIFAFASFGVAVLIYMILWIVTPKAITAKQKLEMKGEAVNVSNIEKSIKQEYSEVKENIKSKSPKIKKEINSFWDKMNAFFLGLGKVLITIIGCLLITIGIISLLSIVGTIFFTNFIIMPFSELQLYNVVPELFLNSSNNILFYISLFLVSGIPFIMLVYAGLKLIFRIKTNTPVIIISLICLWFFGIINIALISANQIKQYSSKTVNYTEPEELESSLDNCIYIKCRNKILKDHDNIINLDKIIVTQSEGQTILVGQPELKFEKSESNKYEILLKRKSRGKNISSAQDNSKNITYNWNMKDSVLYLDCLFKINGKQQWKDQELDVIIKVPENKNVILGKDVIDKLDLDSDDFYHYYHNYRKGYKWTMKKSGKLKNIK